MSKGKAKVFAEVDTKVRGTTKVIRCTCAHDFQDERYGKSMRVHNAFKEGDRIRYRCTVCSGEK